MGVVGLPSRVTGLAAISMSEEITFMPGWWASSNSSQYGLEEGLFWRLIFMRTDLCSAIIQFFLKLLCLLRSRSTSSRQGQLTAPEHCHSAFTIGLRCPVA